LAKTTVTTALALYLKWARQHPGNKTEHTARAEYDVTSSILGKAPAPIHCHVFAESLFWLGLAYSIARHFVAIFPGNVYGFLISCQTLSGKLSLSWQLCCLTA
jgi:hypothetical protein